MFKLLAQEIAYYRKLSANGRDLLGSFILYGAGLAIIGIFMTAFLWNRTASLGQVALFSLVGFIVIPGIFILNGYLLRWINIKTLYVIGLVTIGIGPILLVFAPAVTLPLIILLGVLDGIGNGLFWANRNYLTMEVVKDKDRNYFFGINSAGDTFSGVAFPIIIGFVIERAGQTFLGSPEVAYRLIMLMGLLLFAIGAFILRDNTFESPKFTKIFLGKVGAAWTTARWLTVSYSIVEGTLFFLPVLLVLIFLGKEASLGTVESFAALLAVIVTYAVGRIASPKHRAPILLICTILFASATVFFSLTYVALAALAFILIRKVTFPLVGIGIQSLWYEAIDEANNSTSSDLKYRYIVDLELFINIGRVGAILIFILISSQTSNETTLRIIPGIIMVGQIGMLIFTQRLNKQLAPARDRSLPATADRIER